MSTHRLELDNGHIILSQDNKRFLLDTGSPISVSDVRTSLPLAGETVHLSPNPMIALATINQLGLTSKPVDGLIGLNLLNGMSWQFDFRNQRLLVNEPVIQDYTDCLPLQVSPMTGLILKANVNGSDCNAILDTGAFVSYVDPSLIGNTPACGDLHDVNPILGEIHTTIHEVQVGLGKRLFTQKVGKMPKTLKNMLALTALLGIGELQFVLGISPLKLDSLCIDLENNRLML